MITYNQTTGQIIRNGLLLGTGYSGFGVGLNNPAMEADADVGPIPHGSWQIIRWDEFHEDKGPIVAVLQPVGHTAFGRTGFLVHGPHVNDHNDSSHGCIVASRAIRDAWKVSGDYSISVISGLTEGAIS